MTLTPSRRAFSTSLLALLYLAGCSSSKPPHTALKGPKLLYSGPRRDKSDVAIIKPTDEGLSLIIANGIFPMLFRKHETAFRLSGDHEWIEREAHVIPAELKINIRYTHLPPVTAAFGGQLGGVVFGDKKGVVSLTFTAEPGREYHIGAGRKGEQSWIWIKDTASGKIVSEVFRPG